MQVKEKEDIYESFKEFYSKGSNAVDLLRDKSGKNYKKWDKKDYLRLAKNPQDAFMSSAKEYFYKEDEYYCILDELNKFKDNEAFLTHFKDVIEFKTRKFYKERLEKHENI